MLSIPQFPWYLVFSEATWRFLLAIFYLNASYVCNQAGRIWHYAFESYLTPIFPLDVEWKEQCKASVYFIFHSFLVDRILTINNRKSCLFRDCFQIRLLILYGSLGLEGFVVYMMKYFFSRSQSVLDLGKSRISDWTWFMFPMNFVYLLTFSKWRYS